MGGGKGDDQVIGYEYYLGIDFAWCHAPVDKAVAFYLDDREIWRGCLTDGSIQINKPELFGEFEGGIKATVDLEVGGESQGVNSYLNSTIAGDVPAYRGVTRTVWRGAREDGTGRAAYVGNNPYLKRFSGEFQRVYKRIVGGVVTDQWQSSIAGVPRIEEATEVYATGTVKDQSIFINVDLSSASNGYTGINGSADGNGADISAIKSAIIDSLIDIRDNLQWENRGTSNFLGVDQGDAGLDIGIGYVRFTNGSQDNTSDNPNNLDPYLAPFPGDDSSSYDLPKRGWIMKENATNDDIDELIEFVNDFVVVPDTVDPLGNSPVETRELTELLKNNVTEAFGNLSTSNTNIRGLIVYSGMVNDESSGTIENNVTTIDNTLLDTASSTDHPIKYVYGPGFSDYNLDALPSSGVGDNSDGSVVTLQRLVQPFGTPNDGRWNITGGGWYLIARDTGIGGTGPYKQATLGPGTPYEVGDRDLVDNPAGGPIGSPPFGFPGTNTGTWYFGPLKETGIYIGRFDVLEHWQREVEDSDEPTTITVNRDGVEYDWNPFHEDSDKFSTDRYSDNGGGTGLITSDPCPDGGNCIEMNPAHIIRECLTDQQWGLGLPEADIDETSFAAAANTLYTERFGLSIAWQRETPIEDFINVILNHIDAVLYVDRTDGLWHLVLIRDDYTPSLLDEYTDADVVSWDNVSIKSPAELVNSVTIKYNSRELRGEASLTVKNFAQIQKLGKVISTTVNYPGIWQDKLATRVAQRDLITLSTSLIAGEIELTRKAYDLAPGDVFKLTSSRYNLSGEVMRVVEVNVGDGRQNTIRVKFTQDKYNFDYSEATDLVDAPDSEWDNPADNDPSTVVDRIVTEEPYYLFVKRNGELLAEEIETQEQDIGYVFAAANPPTDSSVYARIRYDEGTGYISGAQVPYGPHATLNADISEEADDTTLTVTGFNFYGDVSVNDLIQIDDEIMKVDSVDSTTQLTVSRGALDTVPDWHYKTSPVFFIGNNGIIDGEYVASDTVDVKLLDNTNRTQLDSALAPVDTVTMDSRITKPYPVGQLQLDGAYRGLWDYATGSSIEATWVHRDRNLQNTSIPPVHTDASVGPEANNNYTISAVAYDYNGEEIVITSDLFSVDKNQDTSHTITTSDYSPDSEGTVPWSAVGVKVLTTREESTSVEYNNWQTPEVMAYTQADPEDLYLYTASWVDVNQLSTVYEEPLLQTNVTADGDPIGGMESVKDTY